VYHSPGATRRVFSALVLFSFALRRFSIILLSMPTRKKAPTRRASKSDPPPPPGASPPPPAPTDDISASPPDAFALAHPPTEVEAIAAAAAKRAALIAALPPYLRKAKLSQDVSSVYRGFWCPVSLYIRLLKEARRMAFEMDRDMEWHHVISTLLCRHFELELPLEE
jgi:hypothetical protein